MDHLSVRFHVRGKLEYDGKEWNYIGGRIGHSTVEVLDLSIEVLKLHLLEFLVISDEDLEDTTLSWRLIDNERNSRCMCRLDDDSNVKNMVKHVTRVADGFVEIFAVSPDELLTRNTHISSISKAACHDELLTRHTDLNEHVIKLNIYQDVHYLPVHL
jgi:hypothetical protein